VCALLRRISFVGAKRWYVTQARRALSQLRQRAA
jgi:hypothetical protein